MGEYDLISELCDICVTLLRVVEAQEGALLQLGAVADAEGAEDAKKRLTALQGRLRPDMNGGNER